MTLPVEFVVAGKPASVNGPKKRDAWKTRVSAAAKLALGGWTGPMHSVEVTVKVFYFPVSGQYIDIDNGLKYTIDALCPPAAVSKWLPAGPALLHNDRAVTRVITERFPTASATSLVAPAGLAATLLKAWLIARPAGPGGAAPEHATAVKVKGYTPPAGGFW